MKKTSLVLLAFALIFSLAACNKPVSSISTSSKPAPSSAEPSVPQTEYPTKWDDIDSFPEGFPKLAEGVSKYIRLGGENKGFELQWDTIDFEKVDPMLKLMEIWVDSSFTERADMIGADETEPKETEARLWIAENKVDKAVGGKIYIDVKYRANPMEDYPQLSIVVNMYDGAGGM